MLESEKERAEHVMLVDLGRNDVRMVSKGGTVKVDDFMSVLKYSSCPAYRKYSVRGTA